MRSSPERGEPRPSRLDVVTHSEPSGARATERSRPYHEGAESLNGKRQSFLLLFVEGGAHGADRVGESVGALAVKQQP